MARRAVLVTRPEPGLASTSEALQRQGWEAIACPMLEIQTYEPIAVTDCAAVALTSANALAALKNWPRDRLMVTVGAKTAEHARAMGFSNVHAADGDAEALLEFCRRHNLTGQSLMLACGKGYGLDLAVALGASRIDAYAVTKRQALTDAARDALLSDRVEGVVLYSGKTAEAFMEALGAPERSALSGVRAFCLSEAIAARLTEKDWRAVEWPDPLERLGPFVT